MEEKFKERNEIIRTTIYIPRHLREAAKMMAILTRTNVSHLMRVALAEKINKLKEEKKANPDQW